MGTSEGSQSADDRLGGFLCKAGLCGEPCLRCQPRDLELDADAAEADEEGGQRKAIFIGEGKNAVGQLQQSRQHQSYDFRHQREEPPP